MNQNYPRKIIHLSPPDRPRWLNSQNLEAPLVFLAWGDRFLGRDPVPVYRHDSWSYTVILKGTPVLRIAEEEFPLRAGEAVLVGPDCPMGWTGPSTRSKSSILGWSWRKTPFFMSPESSSRWFRIRLSPETIKSLQVMHRRCRQEVEIADSATSPALDALRALLDVEFCRHLQTKRTLTNDHLRFQLSVRWMEQHLDASQPIQRLGEYLQVSPATLKVLFQRKSQTSPLSYFQALKFECAQKRLRQKGSSVKAVAFSLGYRNPNHFSRAFFRHTGQRARDLKA
jgi:AraC-like DNA-binding protein